MLYASTLDTGQKADRFKVCGWLPDTTGLYIALADSGGYILPKTGHRFQVKDGSYHCTAVLRDLLVDGGLFSGRTAAMRDFSAVHIKYAARDFERAYSIPVESAKYLVVGAEAPRRIPLTTLEKTWKMEQNPFYQERDEYLASIGAGAEAAECYQDNLLVSQPESMVPEAVVSDGFAVVPIPFRTICRIGLKRTSKGLIVGLRVQFRNS